jgi:hypothetical protein
LSIRHYEGTRFPARFDLDEMRTSFATYRSILARALLHADEASYQKNGAVYAPTVEPGTETMRSPSGAISVNRHVLASFGLIAAISSGGCFGRSLKRPSLKSDRRRASHTAGGLVCAGSLATITATEIAGHPSDRRVGRAGALRCISPPSAQQFAGAAEALQRVKSRPAIGRLRLILINARCRRIRHDAMTARGEQG